MTVILTGQTLEYKQPILNMGNHPSSLERYTKARGGNSYSTTSKLEKSNNNKIDISMLETFDRKEAAIPRKNIVSTDYMPYVSGLSSDETGKNRFINEKYGTALMKTNTLRNIYDTPQLRNF